MLLALLLAAALDQSTVRNQIEAGEKAWGNAFVMGDVATVDRLLADDFAGTGPDGAPYDKPTMLGWLREGPSMTSNSTTIVKVRFFGTVAVVNGRDDFITTRNDHRTNAWTDVWALRDGHWRIISAQDTRIAAKP